MNDERTIKLDRLRYTKNTASSRLAILAILFDVFFFVSIYKSDVGSWYYTILIGASILYNLIFMLAAFLASEGVKNYKPKFSYLLFALGIIQVVRIFILPVRAHGSTVKIKGEVIQVMKDAQFIRVVIYLAVSAVCLLASGVINLQKSRAPGEGVTLADGKTYNTGDLKPTWAALEEILGIKFEDKYQGNSAAKEFEYWKDRLNEVDMVSGTASTLSEYGEAGSLVNLAEYLDQMPSFKAYLEANPIVRLSVTGNTSTGAIYFSPYFDGVNDIERMPLMRVDWAIKLLDGEGEFTAEACGTTADPVYQPYMPLTGKIEIETPTADGTAIETVTKDYDAAGNIVALMNEKGAMSGVEAVNMLREYIDKTYNGYYGGTGGAG